jgi:hypothetical protein
VTKLEALVASEARSLVRAVRTAPALPFADTEKVPVQAPPTPPHRFPGQSHPTRGLTGSPARAQPRSLRCLAPVEVSRPRRACHGGRRYGPQGNPRRPSQLSAAALSKAFFDDPLTACRSPAATWSPAPATVACHWRRRERGAGHRDRRQGHPPAPFASGAGTLASIRPATYASNDRRWIRQAAGSSCRIRPGWSLAPRRGATGSTQRWVGGRR